MRTWSGKIRSRLLITSRLRSKISGQRLAAGADRTLTLVQADHLPRRQAADGSAAAGDALLGYSAAQVLS
jgi:hypothetical protein